MKYKIIFLIVISIMLNLTAQNPNWEWVTQASGDDIDRSYKILIDSNGNSYVTGYFAETVTFGIHSLTCLGPYDIFVAKLDANGNWLWATQAGGTWEDFGFSLALDDNGNVYVTGRFFSTAFFGTHIINSNGWIDIFVAKLDTNGNWLWVTQAGSSDWDCGKGIKIDYLGDILVTGTFGSSATFGSFSLTNSGSQDIFVAKLDSNGNWLWATQAGGNGYDDSNSISIDDDGNSYITGSFEGSAIFGSNSLTSSNYDDIYVAKLDANGNWLWAAQAGGSSNDVGESIEVDIERMSYVTGSFQNTAAFGSIDLHSSGFKDVFLAKLDTSGNWIFATKAGGSGFDDCYGITVDNNGNSYVTGSFTDTITFGSHTLENIDSYDIFVAKMDVNGNWLWATQAGGENSDIGVSIAIDDLGNSYVTGWFRGSANFGLYSLISLGSYDIFVAKLGNYFADFAADIFGGYPPLQVHFTDLSSFNATYWEWDFDNDGIVDSNEQNPTTEYNQSGTYTVTLTVSDGSNIDTEIKENYITVVDDLTADFEGNPISGSSPLEVQFTDLTIIDPISWEWDFINNGLVDSYEQNPTFTYLEPGIYTVTLTVYDGSTTDTEIKEEYISVNFVNSDNELLSCNTQLYHNYPNPFNPSTTIVFSIQNDSKISLSIFNIKGQKIKSLAQNDFAKGSHSIIWNGYDDFGNPVSSGIYYYKLKVNGKVEAVKKCLLLK